MTTRSSEEHQCLYCLRPIFLFDKAPTRFALEDGSGWATDQSGDMESDFICSGRSGSDEVPRQHGHEPIPYAEDERGMFFIGQYKDGEWVGLYMNPDSLPYHGPKAFETVAEAQALIDHWAVSERKDNPAKWTYVALSIEELGTIVQAQSVTKGKRWNVELRRTQTRTLIVEAPDPAARDAIAYGVMKQMDDGIRLSPSVTVVDSKMSDWERGNTGEVR